MSPSQTDRNHIFSQSPEPQNYVDQVSRETFIESLDEPTELTVSELDISEG